MPFANRLSPSGPINDPTVGRDYNVFGNLPMTTAIPAVNSTSAATWLTNGLPKQIGKDLIYECGADEDAQIDLQAHYPTSSAAGRLVVAYSTWSAAPGAAGAWSAETPLITELGADGNTSNSLHIGQSVPKGRVKLRILAGTTTATPGTAGGFSEVTDVITNGWSVRASVSVRKSNS